MLPGQIEPEPEHLPVGYRVWEKFEIIRAACVAGLFQAPKDCPVMSEFILRLKITREKGIGLVAGLAFHAIDHRRQGGQESPLLPAPVEIHADGDLFNAPQPLLLRGMAAVDLKVGSDQNQSKLIFFHLIR